MATSKPQRRIKKDHAYHHGNLQAAAMTATLKLVAKHGPSGFTLVQTAKMAGVVPSALYRHFSNREALLAAVAQQGFEMLLSRLKPSPEVRASSPHDSLVSFGVEYFRFAVSNPSHFKAMFAEGIDKRRFPGLLEAACETLKILKAITSGIDGRGGEDLAAAAWAIIHGTSVLTLGEAFLRTGLDSQSEQMLMNALKILADSGTMLDGKRGG